MIDQQDNPITADEQSRCGPDWALHYAFELRDRGLNPIPMNGKVPAVRWSEYQHRLVEYSQLRDWFHPDRQNNFNVGICCGRVSGIVVVDVDEDASFWRSNRPSTPLEVRSGGGGHHFYYRHPMDKPIGNRTRVLHRAIDLRADGGVIVSGGSIHPSGRPYEFVTRLEEVNMNDLPVFDPSWIETSSDVTSLSEVRVPQSSTPIRNVCRWIMKVKAISGERGHSQAFKVACKLRDSGMSEQEAFEAMVEWNSHCAHPPFSERELQHKIGSSFEAKRRVPSN